MTTTRIVAWLANQMHQYASARAISLERGDKLYLDIDPFYYDTREFELDLFCIEAEIATKRQKPWYLILWKNKLLDKIWYYVIFVLKKLNPFHIIENPFHPFWNAKMFDFNSEALQFAISAKHDIYLEGFWHSEKYFKKYEDIIRKDFTLKKPIEDEYNLEIIKKMEDCNAVSIHVRRWDYAWTHYENICGIEYYKTAIDYMKKNLDNPIFFVLSDDIDRCKIAFKDFEIQEYCENGGNPREKNKIISWIEKHGSDAYKNMILMSKCKHNIIANSTFSRWWARLNPNKDKIVIAPKKRHANIDYNDIIPLNRVRL